MKKMMPIILKYSAYVASLSLVFATMANHTNCVLAYHQPKVPAGLARFKK